MIGGHLFVLLWGIKSCKSEIFCIIQRENQSKTSLDICPSSLFSFCFVCRIHGMLVGDTGEYFHSEINKALDGLNWSQKHPGVQSQDMCEMYEEAQGRGYALSSPDELGK